MANITNTRVAEMLNDLEDFETDWTEYEANFIRDIQMKMEEHGDKFKLVGNHQSFLEKTYDKYCKKSSV